MKILWTVKLGLKKQSKEANFNLRIAVCYYNQNDLTNAKLYLENAKSIFKKKQLLDNCEIGDKFSLAEIHLINGDYNDALDISNKLITDSIEESSDDLRYLAPLFVSISLKLLNKEDESNKYLEKIGKTKIPKININTWDFSEIELVLDKTGNSKQFFKDAPELKSYLVAEMGVDLPISMYAANDLKYLLPVHQLQC